MRPKIEVVRQGKIIIEEQDVGDECLILFPDGTIKLVLTIKQAEAEADRWFERKFGKRTDMAIGVGEIEIRSWRTP